MLGKIAAKPGASLQSATSSQACMTNERRNNNAGPPTVRHNTPVPGLQSIGRVDHYFQSSEQHQGSDFLKQLFQYQLPSCIAVQGGGTEGYVVNKAYIMEEQLKQEKLLQIVENLKRENARLKNSSA